MDAYDYQEKAARTARRVNGKDAVINWALGLAGETGEIVESVKKYGFHGHVLDLDKMEEEIGDLLWYVAMMCESLGLDLGEVMAANLDKLAGRYPEGFSEKASRER